jgi:4-hydroxy-tetrahydrodipicolinate reductase
MRQYRRMTYKVIQWSTGNVGQLALRGIINHPDLELAGLLVHSDAKAGLDAGELCGMPATGVKATTDLEAILRTDADCVSYTATADLRPQEAVDDMVKLLESGFNVVSSSVVPLVYPPAADPALVEPLAAACKTGNASFFTSGIDPGFGNEFFPLALTAISERVDSLRVMEVLNYDTYDQPTVLFDTMGFGKPIDHTPMLLLPGVLTFAWGPVVAMIAAGLGVELDEITEHYEKWPAERDYETAAGTVATGTQAGLRFELRGMKDGRAVIVVEHVTRMHDSAAPDWPQPTGAGCYRVLIEGQPRMRCNLELLGENGDHNEGGLVATAMRLLNAIPAVCEAPAGMLSMLDLPLVAGKHLVT